MRHEVVVCDKCGKETLIKRNNYLTQNQYFNVNLGRVGYGNPLFDDNCEINFDLCSKCMYELIKSFKNKDVILHNSNDNYEEIAKAYEKLGEGTLL